MAEQNMLQAFQTPSATDMSLSQAFALKTTRPSGQNDGTLSPVPQKPPLRRVYARRKSLAGSASSRSLKENAFYTTTGRKSEGLKLNLQTQFRARRTTSFASLKDRRKENEISTEYRLARKSSKTSSRRSLASPFSSQPSSPNQDTSAPNAGIARSNSKRDRSSALGGQDLALPETKRRHSARSAKGAFPAKSRSPRNPSLGDTEIAGYAGASAPLNLNRRPSHPNLGPKDDVDLFQAGIPAPDFNRPPSQLSIYAPVETTLSNPLTRTHSVTSTDLFAADICAASTPYNAARISTLVLAQDDGLPTSPRFLDPSPTLERRDTLDNLSENMSLTSVMEPSAAHNDELAGRSPWITDSLISPPTIYRKEMLSSEEDSHLSSPNQLVGPAITLKLDALTSVSDNLQVLLANSDLGGDTLGIQGIEGTSTGVHSTNNTTHASGRTRSGTIVAPTPTAASAHLLGRTRTGTVTGSAIPTLHKQTRQRSGTITPNSAAGSSLAPALPVTEKALGGGADAPLQEAFAVSPLLKPANSEGPLKALEVDVEVLVDADYDPTPVEEMQFSSAPNPDIDIDFDDDVDVTFCSSHAPDVRLSTALAPPSKGSRKLKLPSPPTESNAKVAFEDKEPPKTGRSRSGDRKLGDTSTDKPSKRKTLKAALGLNIKPSVAGAKQQQALSDATRKTHYDTAEQENPVSSSDPLDLLSHFDETDFNRPYEAPVVPKKTARGSRGKATKASRH